MFDKKPNFSKHYANLPHIMFGPRRQNKTKLNSPDSWLLSGASAWCSRLSLHLARKVCMSSWSIRHKNVCKQEISINHIYFSYFCSGASTVSGCDSIYFLLIFLCLLILTSPLFYLDTCACLLPHAIIYQPQGFKSNRNKHSCHIHVARCRDDNN